MRPTRCLPALNGAHARERAAVALREKGSAPPMRQTNAMG